MPFNKEHKYRLVRYVTFLEKEIEDYVLFTGMTHEHYIQDRSKRRDVERWIENQINATVDIAKVILNAEDLPVPDTRDGFTFGMFLLTRNMIEEIGGHNEYPA